MYNSQQVADVIRTQTTLKKVGIKQMLKDIGLGVNTLSHLDNGSMPKADNLAKIADYLGCSVDYLLGRTDEPNTNGPAVNVSGSQQNPPTEQARELDNEFSTLLLRLSLRERVELMSMIYKYVDEHSEK